MYISGENAVVLCVRIWYSYRHKEQENKLHRKERQEDMYRVYRVHRDSEGNIFHRVPIGCARTEKGARALVAGQHGECVIEKIS